jgi:hypothetical protein
LRVLDFAVMRIRLLRSGHRAAAIVRDLAGDFAANAGLHSAPRLAQMHGAIPGAPGSQPHRSLPRPYSYRHDGCTFLCANVMATHNGKSRMKIPSRLTNSQSFASGLFIAGGTVLTLFAFVLGSYWDIACFFSLIPIGILWTRRRSLAAALSVGPLATVAFVLVFMSVAIVRTSGIWGDLLQGGIWTFYLGFCCGLAIYLSVAILLVISALRGTRRWQRPMLVSLLVVSVSFAIDRHFTNVVTVESFQMKVALEADSPESRIVGDPEWFDGRTRFILYRRVGNLYCFDRFQSEELYDRLKSKRLGTVPVEYNEFSSYGRVHGYNVRSVDGVILANGWYSVKDAERGGGTALVPDSSGHGHLDGHLCY